MSTIASSRISRMFRSGNRRVRDTKSRLDGRLARAVSSLVENLESRQLLSVTSLQEGPVQTTQSAITTPAFLTGRFDAATVTALSTTQEGLTVSSGWNPVGTNSISIPQFDTMGGTRVLVEADVQYEATMVMDFNFDVQNLDASQTESISASGTGNVSLTPTVGSPLAGSVSLTLPATTIQPAGTSTPPPGDHLIFQQHSIAAPTTSFVVTGTAGLTPYVGAGNLSYLLNASGGGTFNFTRSSLDNATTLITTVARAEVEVTYKYVVPQAKITLSANSVNEVNNAHVFTATVLVDDGFDAGEGGDGVTGFTPAATGTPVSFSLANNTAGATITAFDATTTGDTATVTVKDATNTTGSVDVHASATVISDAGIGVPAAGVTLSPATGDGLNGDGPNANKRWVDLEINLTPLTSTNPINQSHTFTATVLQDDGLPANAPGGDAVTGFGPVASGTPVSFGLSNNTAGATITAATGTGVIAVGGLTATAVTIGDIATVTVLDALNTIGSVTINASTHLGVGGVTPDIVRSTGDGLSGDGPNAVKTWVQGDIIWKKENPNNALLGGATFTVKDPNGATVTVVDNTGQAGYIGLDTDPVPGQFELDNLTVVGVYTITETVAPAGFNLDPTPQTETLDATLHITTPEPVFHDTVNNPFTGLTPGFWKQTQHFGAWTGGFVPTGAGATTLGQVFSSAALNGVGVSPSTTFLTALNWGGGSTVTDAAHILIRQAVAGLLNAAATPTLVNYSLTIPQIETMVNTALATKNRGTILALEAVFDSLNNI